MIEMGKQYKTHDGKEVRIYATDGSSDLPVHGAVKSVDGSWLSMAWTRNGDDTLYGDPLGLKLVEVKPKRTLDMWVNVYRDETEVMHKSREDADLHADADRIACLHIVREYEEGEGL